MELRSTAEQEIKALWSNGKGVPLITISVGWGLLVGTRVVYPVIIPQLQNSYGLSLTFAGLLVTVLWLFYSIGQLPSGIFADKYNERTLMVTSTILVAIAIGFVVTSSTILVLFLATGLIGLASSLYPIARMTYLSHLYSDRFGSALGVTMAAADFGQTILPPIASILAVAIAWQAGLGFVIPFLITIAVVLLITVSTSEPLNNSTSTASLRETLGVFSNFHKQNIRNGAILLFLYMLIWQSFTAFYPTYLLTAKSVSSTVASILFGLFFAVGIPMKILAGAAYDRLGIRKSLIGILLPPVLGFVLLPLVTNFVYLFISTILISIMLGSGTVTQSYLADSLPAETQGAGLGAVRSSVSIFASGGPVLFGIIADYNYFDEGYLIMAGIMILALVLTFRMSHS